MNTWWQRNDLRYKDGILWFGEPEMNRSLVAFSQSQPTPAYLYSAQRIYANLTRLHSALDHAGVKHHIHYALKANRFLPLVISLKASGLCGIDCCSPAEVRLARQVGFREDEISFTGTSVSNADLDVLLKMPALHINCDAISTIRRIGERSPEREIGIRINPQLGVGYNERVTYAGKKATKFGIYPDRFAEAVALAHHYNLRITTLHFHAGSGYLSDQLDNLAQILGSLQPLLHACPTIHTINIGGGLGLPLRDGEKPLDLTRWATILGEFANPRQLTIQVEPGDYVVKDAGILLLEVNTVEEKGGKLFVGVNGGFNLQVLYAYYDTPFVVVPLHEPKTDKRLVVDIAGNINEAIDLLAQDISLPPVHEGDVLAFLNTGGYGSAMSSNHCMRGTFTEYWLP